MIPRVSSSEWSVRFGAAGKQAALTGKYVIIKNLNGPGWWMWCPRHPSHPHWSLSHDYAIRVHNAHERTFSRVSAG